MAPYTRLASIYDHVMRHVNYERWARYLSDLFAKADFPVTSILDIACGTGSLLAHLHRLHFTVAGFDASFDMVSVARQKAKKQDRPLPLWQGNMGAFRVKQPFDACVCTYDSINYCLDLDGYLRVFNCVSESLRPGGLFIFDVCTERNSRKYFRNHYENEATREFLFVRQSHYLHKERIQVNEFLISFESDRRQTFRECHRQRIFRIKEIEGLIDSSVFELIGLFDGFSRRPGGEKSNRVHFVLKRI